MENLIAVTLAEIALHQKARFQKTDVKCAHASERALLRRRVW
jgi:hypothetical protein